MKREQWRDWATRKPCPSCQTGLILPQKNNKDLIRSETSESIEIGTYGGYTQKEYVFSIHLKCSNCDETVVASGIYNEDETGNEDIPIATSISPKSFIPSLKIIHIPQDVPRNIKQKILESFGLYWNDLGSCANKIRISIEVILNELNIPHHIEKGNKKQHLTLHKRILLYEIDNKEVASYLLAIKWIGNEGSHHSDLNQEDVLNAYEMLEYALEILYDDKSLKLMKLRDQINNSKKS